MKFNLKNRKRMFAGEYNVKRGLCQLAHRKFGISRRIGDERQIEIGSEQVVSEI